MSDNAKISRLEAKINEIMGRPTYSSTPAWQSEVAEMRLQIEALRTGKVIERKEYKRLTVDPQGVLVFENEAPEGAHEGGHDAEHHEAPYIAIFVGLFLLTILEWKCAQWFGIHGVALWIILAGMAVVKALMVAFYFMHLKFERKTIYVLLTLPVILVIVMVGLLIPDSQQQIWQYLSHMVGF